MKKFKKTILLIWRFPLRLLYKIKLKNHNFTIISQNCIGGTLYHDCGEIFCSPTINLSFSFEEFIKFCENLKYYLSIEPVFSYTHKEGNYPVCSLNDISIHCVHYNTFMQFKEDWNRRKSRIDFNNLFIMCVNRTEISEDLIEIYNKLPFAKICFVSESTAWKFPNYNFAAIPDIEKQDLTSYVDIFGRRGFEKYFDCIKWLNVGKR